MAKPKPGTSSVRLFKEKAKAKRKGIISKKKSSQLKSSKNYLKLYRGQGK